MKAFKYILLFVVCMVMVACGDNLDNYKEKTLEYLAKKNKTTVELFVKDYSLVMDSMSVTPITVADSMAIVNLWKDEQGNIEERIKRKRQELHSIFNFDDEKDRKELNRLETRLKEIHESEEILEKFASMNPDNILGKFFTCRISLLIPLFGRKTQYSGFVFDPKGVMLKKEADILMIDYFKDKNKK